MARFAVLELPHQEGLLAEASRFGRIDVLVHRAGDRDLQLTMDIEAPGLIVEQLAGELRTVAKTFHWRGSRMTMAVSIAHVTADSLLLVAAHDPCQPVWIQFRQGAARIHTPADGPHSAADFFAAVAIDGIVQIADIDPHFPIVAPEFLTRHNA